MYVSSIALFTLGSILCGIANGLNALVAARVLQALGGGALTPVALAMLSIAFDDKERGSVMGWWGLGVVVGPAMGPTIGGFLTQFYGWPYIVYVNIPFGILALALSFKYLKKLGARSGSVKPFDLSGYIYFIVFLVLLQFGISQLEILGWTSPWLYAAFAVSFISLYAFIKTEKRKEHPVLNLELF